MNIFVTSFAFVISGICIGEHLCNLIYNKIKKEKTIKFIIISFIVFSILMCVYIIIFHPETHYYYFFWGVAAMPIKYMKVRKLKENKTTHRDALK
ncbi:MAG TPA: hypothetical protein VJ916_06875 [Anaerovoracaceae bacterium]|nr:hypothetical protein [Anaerovoracaceae bacterium]